MAQQTRGNTRAAANKPPQRQQTRTQQQQAQPENDWEGADQEPADAADSGYGSGTVPEGWYDVEVMKATVRQSNSSGKDYPNLDLKIAGGDYDGRHVFCAIYINSDSDGFRQGQKKFCAKWFEVCTGEVPQETPKTDDDMSPLVGQMACVFVVLEDNNDLNGNKVEVNRVVRVRPLGEDTATDDETTTAEAPPPPQQQRTQQPRQNARTAQAQRGNGQQRPPARGRGSAGFDDMQDDVPF